MLTGIIPCGGYGTRLGPLAAAAPKALLPVAGIPLVVYNLSIMKALGIAKVVLVTSHHTEAVRAYVGTTFDGMPVEYALQESPQGLLDAVYQARHAVEDRFITLLSDEVYVDCDHKGFIDRLNLRRDLAGLVGFVMAPDPARIRQNYSIEMTDARIERLEEKPVRVSNSLLGTGTWGLDRSFFDYATLVMRNNLPDKRSFVDVLQAMIDDGRLIEGFDLQGRYVNVNSPADVDLAQAMVNGRHPLIMGFGSRGAVQV